MTSSPLRSEKLDLRLTPGAKQTLQRAASASAAEPLADRQSFQLDGERWEALLTALDAAPQLHPRLARLLQEPSVVEQSVMEAPPAAGAG